MDLDSNWTTIGLVVVKYPKNDLVGMFFGYYSLLVYQIQAIYITLFLWNRDLLTFYCCFTHMLSEIITYLLKHTLKHPRPEQGPPVGGLFEGRYGMPSQHCHCFAYLFTMVLLLVFHYYRKHISLTTKLFTAISSVVALTLQVFGRLYLNFHTVNQCLVGVLFGSLSAITFYSIGLYFFIPYSETICKYWLLRMFSFRKDLSSPSSPPPTITSRTSSSGNNNNKVKLSANKKKEN